MWWCLAPYQHGALWADFVQLEISDLSPSSPSANTVNVGTHLLEKAIDSHKMGQSIDSMIINLLLQYVLYIWPTCSFSTRRYRYTLNPLLLPRNIQPATFTAVAGLNYLVVA